MSAIGYPNAGDRIITKLAEKTGDPYTAQNAGTIYVEERRVAQGGKRLLL